MEIRGAHQHLSGRRLGKAKRGFGINRQNLKFNLMVSADCEPT
jgi:hypothetical protein